jgi:hypothetical protein
MIVLESEDAARAASEHISLALPEGVHMEDIEVREVVANAWVWRAGRCVPARPWLAAAGSGALGAPVTRALPCAA